MGLDADQMDAEPPYEQLVNAKIFELEGKLRSLNAHRNAQ